MNAQRRHNVSRDARLGLPGERALAGRSFVLAVALLVIAALVAVAHLGGLL